MYTVFLSKSQEVNVIDKRSSSCTHFRWAFANTFSSTAELKVLALKMLSYSEALEMCCTIQGGG